MLRPRPLVFTFVLSTLLAPAAPSSAAPYEMSAYTDRPGGPEVMVGAYDAAVAAAARPILSRDWASALVASTNLCVAHTMNRSFPEAYAACAEALRLAVRADERPYSLIRARAATAKALSNRGVLRAISGDAIGAARDFRKAARLSSARGAPARNLAKLESSPAYRLALSDER
jgi:hypothetical protein